MPGGHVDRGESSSKAAAREVREETGLTVEIVSLLTEGRNNPWKTYLGKVKGGRLKAKRPECRDAKFWRYDRLPTLAFNTDRIAIDARLKMQAQAHQSSGVTASAKKRERATALVIRDGKYLLVRDKGRRRFSLPGGGIEKGEAALTAACRELGEELGLRAYKAERLFDYNSEESFNVHKVVLIYAGGDVRMNDGELEAYMWWDGEEDVPVYPNVSSIIARYQNEN